MGKNGSCVISADLTTLLKVYNPYMSGEVSGIVGIVLIIFVWHANVSIPTSTTKISY